MRMRSIVGLALLLGTFAATTAVHAQPILGLHAAQPPYFGYPFPEYPFVYPRAYPPYSYGGYPYGYPYQPGFYFRRGFGPRAHHRGDGVHGFTLGRR